MSEQNKNDFFADNSFIHTRIVKLRSKSNPKEIVEYEIGIKELTGEEATKIAEDNAIKEGDNPKNFKMDTNAANLQLMKMSLIKAPFEINDENLKKLSMQAFQQILQHVSEINGTVTEEEEKK